MELTVNQLLDSLTSQYRMDEIRERTDLRCLWDKLSQLKLKYMFGGTIRIRNSGQILDRIKGRKNNGPC